MKISASFLSIDKPYKENISKLTKTNIDYLHLDIMDGIFVDNKSFNYLEIKEMINYDKPLDIHLMVDDIYKYIEDFSSLNPEFITFHYEVKCDIMALVMYLKDKNIKVGLSINPDTKVECLIPFLPFIDLVLIMSVYPGRGGQKFIDETIEKLEKLDKIKKDNLYNFLIEVDGGINKDTINLVDKADIAVVGSYITNGNYEENVNNLK